MRYIIAIALLWLPTSVHAGFPRSIVPCGLPGGDPCNACHVAILANNIVIFLVAFSVFAAAIVMVVAGFRMMAARGNTGEIEKAKGMLANAIIGFLIVLAAFLIVDTVIKGIARTELFGATANAPYGPWNRIQCTTPGVAPAQTTQDGDEVTGQPGQPSQAVAPPTPPGTHQSAIDQFAQNPNIIPSSTGGPDAVNPNCNGSGCSAYALQQDTVDQVELLQQACGCRLVLTGGSEPGHSTNGPYTHGNGYKIDIDDDNPVLNKYLENPSNLTYAGQRSGSHGGPIYVDRCGNQYVRESTHWDITVSKGVCTLPVDDVASVGNVTQINANNQAASAIQGFNWDF